MLYRHFEFPSSSKKLISSYGDYYRGIHLVKMQKSVWCSQLHLIILLYNPCTWGSRGLVEEDTHCFIRLAYGCLLIESAFLYWYESFTHEFQKYVLLNMICLMTAPVDMATWLVNISQGPSYIWLKRYSIYYTFYYILLHVLCNCSYNLYYYFFK